jgi:hypothetical protein
MSRDDRAELEMRVVHIDERRDKPFSDEQAVVWTNSQEHAGGCKELLSREQTLERRTFEHMMELMIR